MTKWSQLSDGRIARKLEHAGHEETCVCGQYPYDICPESLSTIAAERGFSYELRGGAFLSVKEAEWLEVRHRFLDTLDR